MTKQTKTNRCATCQGFDKEKNDCRIPRIQSGGFVIACEFYRERKTRSEVMAWVSRRDAIERKAAKANLHAYHISVLTDIYDPAPLVTMHIWDEAAGQSITVTEDDGPDDGLERCKQIIDKMIADGNVIPKRTGPDPREKWA